MTTTIIISILVILSIVGYFAIIKPHMDEFNRLKRYKDYCDTNYLRKSGGTKTFGSNGFDNPIINYDLRSWDAGKNWYLIDYNFNTGEFKVLGLVDTIYPSLLEHLESWDRMTEYVIKNGPIKLDDPNGLKVLNDAGFSIVNK